MSVSRKLLSGENLLQSHISNERSLPKVGEKQFKPTGSWLEKKQIQTALDENKQLLEEERVEKFGALAQAVWYNQKRLAEVTKKVGKYFHTIGFERDGKLFIYPEEALYLLEMNCLQLTYDGVPLSIQQAYSLLLSTPGCSLKEYRAYSHLKKHGYRLLRYTKTGMPTNYERKIRLDQHVAQKRVFPDTDEVTLEPVSCNVPSAPETNEEEDNSPVECTIVERTEKSDIPVKSEKDSAEVSESMRDFAKSVADMGKSLVKSEEGAGTEGLGLDSLRQKILDMLEDHFQGHISAEAMDAVSRSASNAILVHVEDVGSKEKSITPNLSDEKRLFLRGSSSEENSRDGEDLGKSEESSGKMPEEAKNDLVQEEVGERSRVESEREAGKSEELLVTIGLAEVPKESAVESGEESQKRHGLEVKKGSEESEEAADKRRGEESDGASRNEHGSETKDVVEEGRSEESKETQDESDGVEKDDAVEKRRGEESVETCDKSDDAEKDDAAEKRRGEESVETCDKSDGAEKDDAAEKRRGEESVETCDKSDGAEKDDAAEKRRGEVSVETHDKGGAVENEKAGEERSEESVEAFQKKGALETAKASENNSEVEMETVVLKTVEETNVKEVRHSQSDKSSDIKSDGSKSPSSMECSSTSVKAISNSDDRRKEPDRMDVNGNEDSSDDMSDLEEEMELPVEGAISRDSSYEERGDQAKRNESSSSENDSSDGETEVLECEVYPNKSASNEDMQVDDDVVEIEDPNTWKNVKVEKSCDQAPSQKRSLESNPWKSFKELQANATDGMNVDDEVDIVAIRNSKDINIELIDISDDSFKPPEEVKAKPKEEIEIVDLDESDSDLSEDSDVRDVKQEKSPKQRPKLVSAFERARDARRKFIMDTFPNMHNKSVCTVDVPLRHLLPPNVNPVQSQYTISRGELYSDRPRTSNFARRPFNPPRYNSYYSHHPRPHHPRQPFRPPVNHMQATPRPHINPAAMQAFQMITSIVLPMFGINNMGPTFMGQPQWNQRPMWQPQRNWQIHQPWRFQRGYHYNHNRVNNRPWHNRNNEREQDVLDRPKRPALLSTPGLATPGLAASWNDDTVSTWNNERSSQEFRRPKRPFVADHGARDLLMDIEDERRFKKIKKMNERESDSDSETEVTITPINPTPRTSDLQPVLRLDQCGSSSEIMAALDVVKTADPRTLNVSVQSRQLKISYDVFLPNIPFKKSSPPTPNFRLCIMSIEQRMPNPGEISLLLDDIHDGVPLMFAVVDPDTVSFFQYSNVDVPKHTFSS